MGAEEAGCFLFKQPVRTVTHSLFETSISLDNDFFLSSQFMLESACSASAVAAAATAF